MAPGRRNVPTCTFQVILKICIRLVHSSTLSLDIHSTSEVKKEILRSKLKNFSQISQGGKVSSFVAMDDDIRKLIYLFLAVLPF